MNTCTWRSGPPTRSDGSVSRTDDGDAEMTPAQVAQNDGSGKGKGKGKDKKGKWGKAGGKRQGPESGACYTCGGPHFARDCPLGKGPGPLAEVWRSWWPGFQPYPAPSAQVWSSRQPKGGKSKGGKGGKNGNGGNGIGFGVMEQGQISTLGAMG